MLSDRRQQILRALIEEYVAHALPVGSKTIAEQYHLGVSSATIRNELSALEGDGYIRQPHTSSGRVPTDAGYRIFVDGLFAAGVLDDCALDESTVEEIRSSADALDDLMMRTSEELARLTRCLSIISAPALKMVQIRQISLISLSNYQALLVIVLQDGQVLNKHLSFDEEVTPEHLQLVQNAVSDLVAGQTMSTLAETLSSARARASADPLISLVIEELVSKLAEANSSALSKRIGMSALLRNPEFQDPSSLIPLMEILEDDTVLFKMLDADAAEESSVSVRIGKENPTDKLAGVSVIAASYGRGEGRGVVCVIGPKRMDYTRVIRAVRGAQNILCE